MLAWNWLKLHFVFSIPSRWYHQKFRMLKIARVWLTAFMLILVESAPLCTEIKLSCGAQNVILMFSFSAWCQRRRLFSACDIKLLRLISRLARLCWGVFLALSFSPHILRRPDLSINNSLIQWRVMTQRPIVTKHSHVTLLLLLSRKVCRSLSLSGEQEGGLMSVLKPPRSGLSPALGTEEAGCTQPQWPIERCEMLAGVDGQTARRVSRSLHRLAVCCFFFHVNLQSEFRCWELATLPQNNWADLQNESGGTQSTKCLSGNQVKHRVKNPIWIGCAKKFVRLWKTANT